MKILDLSAPVCWGELTQQQLRLLLRVIDIVNRWNFNRRYVSREDYSAQSSAQVGALCLLKWNRLNVVCPYADGWLLARDGEEFYVTAEKVAAATLRVGWIAELPETPVRLETIDGATAVGADLDDGFSFDNWLTCEALWQGYQQSNSDEALRLMAENLYRKPGIKLRSFELLGVFYWWAGVKNMMARMFPNFFQPAPAGTPAAEVTPDAMRRSMNSQIRALTKGDITKEERILAMECHRALTELDALSKEFEELNRKYPTKK